MALPRLDYTPPDYSERISQGLGSAAKVAESLSPAHPLVQQALRRIYGGEDPRAVAIETKFAMSRQQQLPAMPSATPPAPARGQVGNLGSTEAVVGPQGGFTGPREFTGEEVVTAPHQPAPARGSQPLMSEPATAQAFYSQAQPEILNRDLPNLMKGAELLRKEGTGDLRELELMERRRQFDAQASLRQAREDLARAEATGIPQRIRQAQQRLVLAEDASRRGWANYQQRETGAYMKGAGEAIMQANAMDQLVRDALTVPGIQIPSGDYLARKTADIYAKIPFIGAAIGQSMRTQADKELTQPQRDFRQRAATAVADWMKAHYGVAITGGEQELARLVTGQMLSFEDTIVALQVLSQTAKARAGIYGQAYPGAARRIGQLQTPMVPSFRPSAPAQQPGYRIEDLSPAQRQQWGVTNQAELDEINALMGRPRVGLPSLPGEQ